MDLNPIVADESLCANVHSEISQKFYRGITICFIWQTKLIKWRMPTVRKGEYTSWNT